MTGACRDGRCIDSRQDLTIGIIDDIAGDEIDAILMIAFGRIEREIDNFPVATCGRAETLSSRLLRLEDEVQWKSVVLEIEVGRKNFEINLLGVIEVL